MNCCVFYETLLLVSATLHSFAVCLILNLVFLSLFYKCPLSVLLLNARLSHGSVVASLRNLLYHLQNRDSWVYIFGPNSFLWGSDLYQQLELLWDNFIWLLPRHFKFEKLNLMHLNFHPSYSLLHTPSFSTTLSQIFCLYVPYQNQKHVIFKSLFLTHIKLSPSLIDSFICNIMA